MNYLVIYFDYDYENLDAHTCEATLDMKFIMFDLLMFLNLLRF